MSLQNELATLYRRDLQRLHQEIAAFPDDATLWCVLPGASNSAGNLALHLEGNLRDFIGRELGNRPYVRTRDLEFTANVPRAELLQRIESLLSLIPDVVAELTADQLDATYAKNVFGMPLSTRLFVLHLATHLNYHLGQIDYLRRILTAGDALKLANFPKP